VCLRCGLSVVFTLEAALIYFVVIVDHVEIPTYCVSDIIVLVSNSEALFWV
jgi:hypothetical protein